MGFLRQILHESPVSLAVASGLTPGSHLKQHGSVLGLRLQGKERQRLHTPLLRVLPKTARPPPQVLPPPEH